MPSRSTAPLTAARWSDSEQRYGASATPIPGVAYRRASSSSAASWPSRRCAGEPSPTCGMRLP